MKQKTHSSAAIKWLCPTRLLATSSVVSLPTILFLKLLAISSKLIAFYIFKNSANPPAKSTGEERKLISPARIGRAGNAIYSKLTFPRTISVKLLIRSLSALALVSSATAQTVDYTLAGVDLATTLDSTPTTDIRVEISTDANFSSVVSTYAGTSGSSGTTTGDRLSALFDTPSGIARDSEGNIFIADSVNHRICLLDTAGEVTSIAGSGVGFTDGEGPSASFRFPTALAVGPNDNLYVADTLNHAIRKLTRPVAIGGTWTVSTLAGTGIAGFLNGTASAAKFNSPQGLTLDQSGNVYVADTSNHRIRLISTTSTVSTFAGTGTAGSGGTTTTDALFDHPFGLAFDATGDPTLNTGNLYIADRDNNLIRRINLSSVNTTDAIEDVATLNAPVSLVVFGDNIYVADKGSQRIIQLDVSGFAGTITNDTPVITVLSGTDGTTGATNGPASTSTFNCPSGICADSDGNLYIADADNHLIRRIIVSGLTALATTSGDAVSVQLDQLALGLGSQETHYFRWIDASNNVVSSTSPPQSFFLYDVPTVVTVAAGDSRDPDAPALFTDRTSATLNASVETQNSSTTVTFDYSTDPALLGPITVATLTLDQALAEASGVAVDSSGNIYVSDYDAHIIYKVSASDAGDGTWTVATLAGSGVAGFADGTGAAAQFDHPVGLAFDPSDSSLYVADELNHRIRRITQDGVVTTVAGSGIAGFSDDDDALSAKLLFPTGVALFGSNLYIADRGNHRIRVLTEASSLATVAGDGTAGLLNGGTSGAQFSNPTDVAVTSSGDVLVADRDNHCIRLVSPGSGFVVTHAGSGTAGSLDGDGIAAEFYSPSGLAIDATDNLYVADRDNHLLRLVDPSGVTTTYAGSGSAGLTDSATGELFPATAAAFNGPTAVAITTEATPNIYLADPGNDALRHVTRDTLPSGSPDQALTASTSATSVTFPISETLLPGATYYFQVRAENGRTEVTTAIDSFTMPALQNIDVSTESDPTTLLTSGQAAAIDFGTTPLGTVVASGFTITNSGPWPLAVSNITAPNGYAVTSGFSETVSLDTDGSLTIEISLNGTPGATYAGDLVITTDDPDTPSFTIPLTGIVYDPPTVGTITVSDQTLSTFTVQADITPNDTSTTASFAYSVDPLLDGFDITTLGGTDTLTFSENPASPADFGTPLGVAIDSSGNIYVADSENHVIEYISSDGTVLSVFGSGAAGFADGEAATAQFNGPQGLAVGEDGTVYVADTLNHRIRVIELDGTVRTLAGTGVAAFTDGDVSAARFNQPSDITIDASGLLYVADRINHRIRTVDSDGTTGTLAGTGVAGSDDGSTTTATLNAPFALISDADGTIYFTEAGIHTIRKISSSTVSTLAGSTATSGFLDEAGTAARFSSPQGLALDSSGNIAVADTGNHTIRLITTSGTVTTLAGSGVAGTSDGLGDLVGITGGTAAQFTSPTSIALDPDGALLVGETSGTLRRIKSNTVLVEAADSEGNTVLTGTAAVAVVLQLENLDTYTPYYFRVIASNSGGTTTGGIVEFQGRTRTKFETWQQTHFGDNAEVTTIAGPDADPDGDTVTNLLEYAFLTDPNDASSGEANQPSVSLRAGRLTINYVRDPDAVYVEGQDEPGDGDLIFEVHSCSNLAENTWGPAPYLTEQTYEEATDETQFPFLDTQEVVLASIPIAPLATPSPDDSPVTCLRVQVTLQTLP